MAEHDDVKRLLTRAVDDTLDDVEVPSVGAFAAQRRQRRRRTLSVSVAVVVTLVLAGAVALASRRTNQRPVAAPSSGSPSSTTSSGTSPAPVPITALQRYRWSSLPPAPIVGRGRAAAVWTGVQMFIWGGQSEDGKTEYADGATYDPASRAWETLPSSPLSARSDPAVVLAGDSVFIWGGYEDADRNALDGALYDPTENRWAMLPKAPISDYAWVGAFWTGRKVVLLSIPNRFATVLRASTFDPVSGHWETLPDLSLPTDHEALYVSAVSAGDHIYAWAHWSYTIALGKNDAEVKSGIDGFTFDAATDRWTANRLVPDQHISIDTPVWTGHELILNPGDIYCGTCSHPPGVQLRGYVVDPFNGGIQPMAHSELNDLRPEYVWTGAALLAYDTGTYHGTPSHADYPGEAALWNPGTNAWTRLADAPLANYAAVSVWTGTSLIEWGAMYPSHDANRVDQHQRTAGLQFGPA